MHLARCAEMPSYLLGPVAGAGVGTYWSAAGDVDATTRQDTGPLSFEHHQPLDHAAIATSSGMSVTSAASHLRQQVATLSRIDRQLNCATPRKSSAFIAMCVYTISALWTGLYWHLRPVAHVK